MEEVKGRAKRRREASDESDGPPPPSETSALEAPVKPVDQLGHLLEPLRDQPEAVLPKVLGLDTQRLRQLSDDLVRRHRPVPVHEVVQVPRQRFVWSASAR